MTGNEAGMQTDLKDWKKEYDGLKKDWFKAKSGVPYKVLFLDEGGERYLQEYEGKPNERVDFQVKVSGGEYDKKDLIWTLTVGGKESLYGMVCKLFSDNGKATDLILDVSCSGDGRSRRYTVGVSPA